MIKINLAEKKKTFKAPVVLGFDLSNFPIKLVLITLLFTQIPLSYFESYLDQKAKDDKRALDVIRKKERALRKKVRKNEKVAKSLEKFNKKIEDLKGRGAQVEQILKIRTNPRHLLEKIARFTPKDLWLESLEIGLDKKIDLRGSSENYRSIGNFIKDLNSTPYFEKSLQLKVSKTKVEELGKKQFQVEEFHIEGTIGAFNPFLEEKN